MSRSRRRNPRHIPRPTSARSTTATVASGPPARTLRASDPAELLAQVTAQLHEVPRDSLALIGHQELRHSQCSARIDLAPLLADPDPRACAVLIEALENRGCTGAFALIILGDGYDEPAAAAEPAGEAEDRRNVAFQLAVALLAAAGPGPFGFHIPEVWVLQTGTAYGVRIETDPEDDAGMLLALAPPVPLAPADSTLIAAQAVLAGERRSPHEAAADPTTGRLRALLLSGPGAVPPWGPPPAIEHSWRRVLAHLEDARGPRRQSPQMTACDALELFVTRLGDESTRAAFLDLVVGRGRPAASAHGRDVLTVVTDPRCIPHTSICAGGAWYEAIEAVLAITRPPGGSEGEPRWERLRPGWATLASVLALCAWWNHRSATARRLAEQALAVDPEHDLARWAAAMADGALAPGWSPVMPR